MKSKNEVKAMLAQFVREVWDEGKIEASDKYIAPEYTIFHDPGDPWENQTLDLNTYKERVRKLRAAFPDQHFYIQDMFADENDIVMTWYWAATHQGDIPGFSATGKEIRMSGATAYFLEGGKLTGHWQITDRLDVYPPAQSRG